MIIQQNSEVVLQSNDIVFDLAIYYLLARTEEVDYRPAVPKFSPDLGLYLYRYGHGVSDVAKFAWKEELLRKERTTYKDMWTSEYHAIEDAIIVKRQDPPAGRSTHVLLDIDNELKFLKENSSGGRSRKLASTNLL